MEEEASSTTCANCSEPCVKVLRCGVCKVATYCSGPCQKEDWRFHKRNCKKPPEQEPEKKQGAFEKAMDEASQKEMEDEMANLDPKMAAQMKQMMAGMLGGNDQKESAPSAPVISCKNCAKECAKPLRCGICKEATYCSPDCQKGDWRFHKRICKKPVAPAGESKGAIEAGGYATDRKEEVEQAPTAKEPIRPKASDHEVVNNEDVGTWYNHRNWKPGEEKKDFTPSVVKTNASPGGAKSGSMWNAAGTWEEKDMLPWWQERIQYLDLNSLNLDRFANTTRVLEVENLSPVSGEAAIVHIRGKPRFFFDLKFSIEFSTGYKTSSARKKGVVHMLEFSNELAAEGEAFRVEIVAASDNDKKAVETEFMPKLKAALRVFITEYESQAKVQSGGAHPGQLPPAQ